VERAAQSPSRARLAWSVGRRIIALSAPVWLVMQPPAIAQKAGELYLSSRPGNVVWGSFPIDRAPVLTIKSGQTVRIDTISQRGATQDEHPVKYFGAFGVKPDGTLVGQEVSDKTLREIAQVMDGFEPALLKALQPPMNCSTGLFQSSSNVVERFALLTANRRQKTKLRFCIVLTIIQLLQTFQTHIRQKRISSFQPPHITHLFTRISIKQLLLKSS